MENAAIFHPEKDLADRRAVRLIDVATSGFVWCKHFQEKTQDFDLQVGEVCIWVILVFRIEKSAERALSVVVLFKESEIGKEAFLALVQKGRDPVDRYFRINGFAARSSRHGEASAKKQQSEKSGAEGRRARDGAAAAATPNEETAVVADDDDDDNGRGGWHREQ